MGRAIRSAVAQTMDPDEYEIIVVDDGSTDNSKVVIEAYRDLVTPVYLSQNKGLPGALNEGILASQGMYITRLDADDFMMKDAIRIMYPFLDFNKDVSYVWADHFLVDEDENIVGRSCDKIGCAIMFKRSVLESIGLYSEEFKICEEVELMVRLDKAKHKGMHLCIPVYKYFDIKGSLSKNKAHGKYINNILKKHFDGGK